MPRGRRCGRRSAATGRNARRAWYVSVNDRMPRICHAGSTHTDSVTSANSPAGPTTSLWT